MMKADSSRITLNRDALPIAVPTGYIGPLTIPGNGRTVWWTGRVAIGLRHEQSRHDVMTQSGAWLQRVMLDSRARTHAHA